MKTSTGIKIGVAAGVIAAAVIVANIPGLDREPVRVRCSVRVTREARPALAAAGVRLFGRGRGSYASLDVVGTRLADGGLELALPTGVSVLDPALSCVTVDAGQPACTCSSGKKCFRTDGGAVLIGVTLSPGTWSGPGCIEKPCGPELAGEQGATWPSECPE